jgi:hypothetical protein
MSRTEIKGLNPIVEDDSSKKEKRANPVQYYVKFSFSITYIFLLTTATITFIEAMRTNNANVRHVLNLETAISIIAGYFYSVFLDKISVYEKEDRKIDWADMSSTRYIDWSMTTPLMLLVLCLVLSDNIGKTVSLTDNPNAKGYIIVFTCNHCPFAKLYPKRLNQLNKKYASLGVPLIAISSTDTIMYVEDCYDKMVAKAKTGKYNFPFLYFSLTLIFLKNST